MQTVRSVEVVREVESKSQSAPVPYQNFDYGYGRFACICIKTVCRMVTSCAVPDLQQGCVSLSLYLLLSVCPNQGNCACLAILKVSEAIMEQAPCLGQLFTSVCCCTALL